MRFAYPRQRETHIYKKKMLSPEDLNQSVDLLKLKQESMRLDREKSIAENANIIDKNSSVQVASEIFAQQNSAQFSQRIVQNQITVNSDNGGDTKVNSQQDINDPQAALNTVATMPDNFVKNVVLAEPSIDTMYQDSF